MSQLPCCFCGKLIDLTFYCYGCKSMICYDCDDENKWPPIGHTKPEQHFLRNLKKKAKKMTKKQEIELLKAELARANTDKEYWHKRYNDLFAEDSKSFDRLYQKHGEELKAEREASNEAIKIAAQQAAILALKAERDTIGQAFKYLADSVAINQHQKG